MDTEKLVVELKSVTKLESALEVIKALGYGQVQDYKVLRFVLSKTWPFSEDKDTYQMSSLDCVLVVMRHILAQSSGIGNPDLTQELDTDPLLHLCLRDFSARTPEKLADMST
ncbi:hypothetical protein DHEL01_v212102 [Diaporthe helianthi]|uniref:Uncharacterized protein n=1 Tax=Diaporthe helianthi TaxID=158607 RepID=A0A2P5HGY6_DIAHE|nr:hypothetical protein DHEL01_v212102 [Diaporthe helianthi]